jgi:hypothetical protein
VLNSLLLPLLLEVTSDAIALEVDSPEKDEKEGRVRSLDLVWRIMLGSGGVISLLLLLLSPGLALDRVVLLL